MTYAKLAVLWQTASFGPQLVDMFEMLLGLPVNSQLQPI